MAVLTLSDKPPPMPSADFGFEIDFQKGKGSPSRVFLATHDFIKACENFDRELVKSIDSRIKPILTLEDIEAGSIKTWLKIILESTDDAALKNLDWKIIVGNYLVNAKSAVIEWIDRDSSPRNFNALSHKIHQLAQETDVRHLPDYTPPSANALISAIKDFQAVKARLVIDDKAKFITHNGDMTFDLSIVINEEELEALAVARKTENPLLEMILPVKKPDYLGDSKWELRHGKRNISAKIVHEDWLSRFQARKIDVRPGDALRCKIKIEYLYGFDNELLTERYTIIEVLEVIQNTIQQIQFPLDQDKS